MRPLLLLCLLAAAAFAEVDTAGKNLTEILEMLDGIEDDLKKTVYGDIKEAANEKKELEEAAFAEMQKGFEVVREKINKAIAAYEEKEAEAEKKLEEERQEAVDQFKQKIEERRQRKEAEKEEAKKKFDELKENVKQKLKEKKAAMDKKKQELEDYLKEMQTTIQQNREEREKEKEQRDADKKAKRDQFINDYKAQRAALKQEKADLDAAYAELKEKKEELRQSVKEAFGQSIRTDLAEAIEDYLQDELEKEVISRGVWNIVHPKAPKDPSQPRPSMPTIFPAPKASLIDTLTGKSSWETVAWILLALCILLALALIALIIYQVVAKKNNPYERLDGHNEGGAVLGVREEKQGLLEQKKSGAGPSYTQGTGSQPQTPTAPPAVEKAEEAQQF